MSVNYKLVQRKNPLKKDEPAKWYATPNSAKPLAQKALTPDYHRRHRPPDVGRVQRQVGNLKKRNMAGRLHVGRPRPEAGQDGFLSPRGKPCSGMQTSSGRAFPGYAAF